MLFPAKALLMKGTIHQSLITCRYSPCPAVRVPLKL